MIELIDTHCHIHNAGQALPGDNPTTDLWLKAGKTDAAEILKAAAKKDVKQLVCVGTDPDDSHRAVEFAKSHENCVASIGIHPHESKLYSADTTKLQNFCNLVVEPRVVAIGECGLDYYYNHSPKPDQEKILRFQIELALENDLPVIFHVREAFDDFWQIFDELNNGQNKIRGVIHSFTAGKDVLEQALSRELYIGLNGIMTFTKDNDQIAAAKAVPLSKLLLETDAPYLTPVPFRGKICKPEYVLQTAEFLAGLRGENLSDLAAAATRNARQLFVI